MKLKKKFMSAVELVEQARRLDVPVSRVGGGWGVEYKDRQMLEELLKKVRCAWRSARVRRDEGLAAACMQHRRSTSEPTNLHQRRRRRRISANGRKRTNFARS